MSQSLNETEVKMFKEMTLENFSSDVAARKPAPGGGSVSALAGSLAAGLAAMVAEFTFSKEHFAERAPQMKRLWDEAEQLREKLLTAVDRDAQSYREVLTAFRLPKSTKQEKQTRHDAVQKAILHATTVPLEVAQYALDVLDLAGNAVEQGNPDMITDAGVGVLLARSAALGALMNAEFNLGSLKDEAVVAELASTIEKMKKGVIRKESEILQFLAFRE